MNRTATNVSGDMFAAKIMEKVTGIKDVYDTQIEVNESAAGSSEDEKTSNRV